MLTMATGEFEYGDIFFAEDPVRFHLFFLYTGLKLIDRYNTDRENTVISYFLVYYV